MRDFSQLLDALVYTRSRTAKLKLIGDYLKRTPDPDRGYALAALTGELDLPAVKPAAIRAIAELLDMPVIRVLEVATFYTMFQLAPVGKHHLQVCGTTPCMLRGAEELKAVCKRRIGDKHAVSKDGLFSWEEVECLGACVNAPVAAIDDYYHEDLTGEALEATVVHTSDGEALAEVAGALDHLRPGMYAVVRALTGEGPPAGR